jgi:hypothetical protein
MVTVLVPVAVCVPVAPAAPSDKYAAPVKVFDVALPPPDDDTCNSGVIALQEVIPPELAPPQKPTSMSFATDVVTLGAVKVELAALTCPSDTSIGLLGLHPLRLMIIPVALLDVKFHV